MTKKRRTLAEIAATPGDAEKWLAAYSLAEGVVEELRSFLDDDVRQIDASAVVYLAEQLLEQRRILRELEEVK